MAARASPVFKMTAARCLICGHAETLLVRTAGGLEITGDIRRPARYGFSISKLKAQKDAQSASSIIVLCKVVI